MRNFFPRTYRFVCCFARAYQWQRLGSYVCARSCSCTWTCCYAYSFLCFCASACSSPRYGCRSSSSSCSCFYRCHLSCSCSWLGSWLGSCRGPYQRSRSYSHSAPYSNFCTCVFSTDRRRAAFARWLIAHGWQLCRALELRAHETRICLVGGRRHYVGAACTARQAVQRCGDARVLHRVDHCAWFGCANGSVHRAVWHSRSAPRYIRVRRATLASRADQYTRNGPMADAHGLLMRCSRAVLWTRAAEPRP